MSNMVNKKDGFDDDDLNLNDTGSARERKRLKSPKVEVFDVLSSKTVPDFSGDAVVHIPKAIFDSLSPDGTRWDALQKWLIKRDEDLIISNAMDIVAEAIRDGFYVEPNHEFHYSEEERFKAVQRSIESLSYLYMAVYDGVLYTYSLALNDRLKSELLKSEPFTTLSSQHDVDRKRIADFQSEILKKNNLIDSLQSQIEVLSRSLTSALASKDSYLKASDELITAQKKQLDSLMDHFLIRLLKRYYDRH